MGFLFGRPTNMVDPADALPGRATRSFDLAPLHVVLGTPLEGPWSPGSQVIQLAMGCFWGAERIFWRQPGVVVTTVGYQGGYTPNPTYDEVCTGRTGHAETVRVVYDPRATSAEALLKVFWENHDPTQGMRQGNDVGTAYRSAIHWTTAEQEAAALATRDAFGEVLRAHGFGPITTQISSATQAGEFYLAEDYHQGYLHKNPRGYCNHGPNGMTCPVGLTSAE